jgi:hypothetical protein
MHAAFPSSKVFDIPGMVNCLKPFVPNQNGPDPTGADIGTNTRVLIDCVTGATGTLSAKPVPDKPLDWAKNIANKTLGAVLSLGPDVANQLTASLRGFVGEFTGENTELITVLSNKTTTTTPAPPPPPSTGQSAEPVIDRVDLTTWAYDRVEGDTYVSDNTGGKKIEVFWKAFSGTQQVRSGCTSAMTIDGPGTSETKNFSSCDFYNSGSFFDVHSPGVYTIRVTVHQESGAAITAQRAVTVLPKGGR